MFCKLLKCFVFINATLAVSPYAAALDFLIDVPPTAGLQPALRARHRSGSRTLTPREPLRRSPSQFQSRHIKISLEGEAFPHLPCLKEPVAFWEKIYKKYDSYQHVVHNRKDIGRVYGVFSGASSAGAKALVSQHNGVESAHLRVQQGLKTRFSQGVKRSLRYLPMVVAHLRANDLPLDLMYLPHVESSFTNEAKSRVGAAGIWQIMPGTMADLLGRWAVPLRNDPDIATEAAIKLLKQNFEATGSWPLALTAYNHGLGGVLRGVRSTQSQDLCELISSYNSPSFGFASANFYAQFLAARRVAKEQYSHLAKSKHGLSAQDGHLLAMVEQGIL